MSFTIEHKWMVIDKQFILRVNQLNEVDEKMNTQKMHAQIFQILWNEHEIDIPCIFPKQQPQKKIGKFSHLTSPT